MQGASFEKYPRHPASSYGLMGDAAVAGTCVKVPDDLAAQIPKEEPVRVIDLMPESAADGLTQEQFFHGCGQDDSIYDAV